MDFLKAIRTNWVWLVAIFAMGSGWGVNTLRVANAQEDIDEVEKKVEKVEEHIDEINQSITRIDTNQHNIQLDVEEIKDLLRNVAESVGASNDDE